MIFIGSYAIKHWFPEFREPVDIDVIGKKTDDPIFLSGKKIEHHWIEPLLDYVGLIDPKQVNPTVSYFPNPNILYTLKCSHMMWDIHWQKTLYDVRFLQDKGCQLIDNLFWDLFNYWPKVHGKRKTPNFQSTSDEFFDNFIDCPIDHETLHIRFAFGSEPLYHRILKDGCEVEIDENKFYDLTVEERFNIIHEECGNLAFERWRDISPKVAYYRALKRMILALTPEWLAKFIIQNYNNISPTQKFYDTWKTLNAELLCNNSSIKEPVTRSSKMS